MPKFRYQAVDSYGKTQRGVLEAQSFQSAMEDLKERGLWIMKLFDQGNSILYREIKFSGPKVKLAHFTVFCRQLATLYKSGVNMVEAVRVLGDQAETKEFKKVLLAVADDMQRGTQFSTAVASYPTIFTAVFTNMIRAGEASGNLDEMLHRLAVFYEKEHLTKEKVKSAMIYPIIMGIVMVFVVSMMMTFVVPRYVSNFQSLGIELPLPTRILIKISDFVKQYFYIVFAGMFVPGLIIGLLRKSDKGSYMLDYIKLRLPVFGKLWHKQALARFSRTFASLFAAAIPMLQTMTIVSNVVGNDVVQKLILESRESLRSGNSIAEPFKKSWLFPPMVVQMMAIGERSGSLDSMMEKVADFYENDVDMMADRLKSLLEPLMILVLSGVVGGIITALMMPTFTLLQNMH